MKFDHSPSEDEVNAAKSDIEEKIPGINNAIRELTWLINSVAANAPMSESRADAALDVIGSSAELAGACLFALASHFGSAIRQSVARVGMDIANFDVAIGKADDVINADGPIPLVGDDPQACEHDKMGARIMAAAAKEDWAMLRPLVQTTVDRGGEFCFAVFIGLLNQLHNMAHGDGMPAVFLNRPENSIPDGMEP